jgi:transcriptional regulator with XRE-family HTH domain
VSASTISRIERGHLDRFSLATIRRVAAELEIRLDLVPRWRGGDLDRLLNARHSALHELVARDLAGRPGWIFQPEVSFAIYAERGVVDLLAFHAARRALLVIELKTDIADVNELVGTIDRKRRLAPQVAASLGWAIGAGVTTSVWVIVAPGRTNRRRIHAHGAMLRAAFPADGRTIDRWLGSPTPPIRCLSFWPDSRGQTDGHGPVPVRRVSRPGRRAASARGAGIGTPYAAAGTPDPALQRAQRSGGATLARHRGNERA